MVCSALFWRSFYIPITRPNLKGGGRHDKIPRLVFRGFVQRRVDRRLAANIPLGHSPDVWTGGNIPTFDAGFRSRDGRRTGLLQHDWHELALDCARCNASGRPQFPATANLARCANPGHHGRHDARRLSALHVRADGSRLLSG